MQAKFFVDNSRVQWAYHIVCATSNTQTPFTLVVTRAHNVLLSVEYTEDQLQYVTSFLKLLFSGSISEIEKYLVYGEYMDATPWEAAWTDPRTLVTCPQVLSTLMDYFDPEFTSTSVWLQDIQHHLSPAPAASVLLIEDTEGFTSGKIYPVLDLLSSEGVKNDLGRVVEIPSNAKRITAQR